MRFPGRRARLWATILLAGSCCILLSAGFAWAAQSRDDCLSCHGDSGLEAADGRLVFVEARTIESSVHGQAGLGCIDCHADLKGAKDFPHAEKLRRVACALCHAKPAQELKASAHRADRPGAPAAGAACTDCHGTHDIRAKDDPDSRVFALNLPLTCEKCHGSRVAGERGTEFIKSYETSVHFRALGKAGLTRSADCSDCHGSHLIKAVRDAASRVSRGFIIRTCGRCHAGIERNYLEGVHGRDYGRGGKDVPVCTDCHNEHAILSPQDVRSPVYATKVAGVCSRCHDDEVLSKQYGFRTSRLRTFSSSFHGVASKFGETRVANCASCHGFHDIRPSSDPRSLVNAANLAGTCGKCHAGAGRNFTRGKIHVGSAEESNPAGNVIRVFYILLIVVVIAVSLLFIGADLWGRLRERWNR